MPAITGFAGFSPVLAFPWSSGTGAWRFFGCTWVRYGLAIPCLDIYLTSGILCPALFRSYAFQIIQYLRGVGVRLYLASLDLNSGSLQAVVCDGPMAENMCLRNPNLKCFPLVYADGSSTDESYGIAVKKGNTALLEAINQILDPLVANGTFDEFFVKHVEASSLLSE